MPSGGRVESGCATKPGGDLAMRLPLLVFHITAGVLAMFAGAAAMSFRKGSRQHGVAGSGRSEGAVSKRRHLRASDGCFEVRKHAELREDHSSRGVAVERLDLAVHEPEDITARRVHPLARWRKDPNRCR